MSESTDSLTGGRRLAQNVAWNIFGTAAPLIVAIATIPFLVKGLGLPRFGLLTMAWMIVGYFSLFDFGLGRALTKLVAEKLGAALADEIPSLIWTGITLMATLGLLGGMLLAAVTPMLVDNIFNIPIELIDETRLSFYLLALSVPLVIATTGLRGVVEAHQRFGLVNLVRIPLGVATYLGPAAVVPFSSSLVPIVSVLIVSRLIAAIAYGYLCFRVEPKLRDGVKIDRRDIRPLISFGGWMTVSNIISPMMVYLDRFLIGSVISMTAVAFYATPYEIATKLLIVPGALMGVMFPAFSAALVQDRTRARMLFVRASNYIYIVIFPAVLIVVTLANEGLSVWLGKEFADSSTTVLQLLSVGVLLNSQAQVPFGMVQGAGRPDLTAKLHLIELVIYLPALWILVDYYGIVGAAIAWAARMGVDAVLLSFLAQRLLPGLPGFSVRTVLQVAISTVALWIGALLTGTFLQFSYLLLTLFVFAAVAWLTILGDDERESVISRLNSIRFLR